MTAEVVVDTKSLRGNIRGEWDQVRGQGIGGTVAISGAGGAGEGGGGGEGGGHQELEGQHPGGVGPGERVGRRGGWGVVRVRRGRERARGEAGKEGSGRGDRGTESLGVTSRESGTM